MQDNEFEVVDELYANNNDIKNALQNQRPIQSPKKKKKVSEQPATATSPSWLYAGFGPTLDGTRNWLSITLRILLTIILVGLAYVPLAGLLTVAGIGALIMTLKVGAFISFALTLTMGITGSIFDYYTYEKGNRDYFFWFYIKDLWNKHFVQSDKATANLIKLIVGALLFVLLVSLLACTCGGGLAIPVITAFVHFTIGAFAATGIFAGSSWAAAVFLTTLFMVAYDALYDIVEAALSWIRGDNNIKQAPVQNEGNKEIRGSYGKAGDQLGKGDKLNIEYSSNSSEPIVLGENVLNRSQQHVPKYEVELSTIESKEVRVYTDIN